MAYEQKANSASLFVNDKKETSNHPDLKGSALIDGKQYWVSAWHNESSKGTKYVSLSFKEKEAMTTDTVNRVALEKTPQQKAREAAHPTSTGLPTGDDFEPDSSLPF